MINRECIAMLLAGGQGNRLGSLTNDVAKPAVSFGGKYRIIDFVLSNCANSGIDNIGVLTQYRPLVLNSYIGIGNAWGINTLEGNITILPPYVTREGGKWYEGTADAIYQNIEYLEKMNSEYVLIVSGDQIYKMDYSKMIKFHKRKDADVTIAVIEVPWEEASRFGIMDTDKNYQIIEFEEKPSIPKSNKASMGIYIFNWNVLKKAIIDDHNNVISSKDFGKNVLPQLLSKKKKMFAYPYRGYWRDVGTIKSYYEANMDLLSDEQPLDLFENNFKIFSNNKGSGPHFIDKTGKVANCIICDGCKILGTVSHSILSNDVFVGRNADIKDSIILKGAVIEDNAIVHKTIVGENVKIYKGQQVGSKEKESEIEVAYEDIYELNKNIV